MEDSKDDNEDLDSSSNDSSDKEDFWENGKEDGSLIALQSIFDSIEDAEVPLQEIPIKHRHSALSALNLGFDGIRLIPSVMFIIPTCFVYSP